MIGVEANVLFKNFLIHFSKVSLEGLEKSTKGSNFEFDFEFDYKYHKLGLKSGWSYIENPEWFKTHHATINPKDSGNKCFKYAITVPLKHEHI